MTPEEAREIWYGQSLDNEDYERAMEAGEVLGYLQKEWCPLEQREVYSLTKLGVLAWEKSEKENRKRRRGFRK